MLKESYPCINQVGCVPRFLFLVVAANSLLNQYGKFKNTLNLTYNLFLQRVSTGGGLANILKDKDNEVKFNDDEKRLICCVLTTSEYCQETTQQVWK